MDNENVAVKQSRPEWGEQELRTVIYQGHEIDGYKIAKDGLCISYKRSKEGKPLEWGGAGQMGQKYPAVVLMIPDNGTLFVDRSVKNYNANNKMVKRTIKIHTMVADTWGEHMDCPEDLEPFWAALSTEIKEVLRTYFVVDHIDNDRCNNHVDNLRFLSPRDNHPRRKQKNNT